MFRLNMKRCWGKKLRPEGDAVGSECLQILPSGTPELSRQQPKGSLSKPRKLLQMVKERFHRNEEPEKAVHLEEISKDFRQLAQEGLFQEACMSISSLAQEGQDCGPQYQLVAQSMWQVVQQALGDIGHSQELELKLQSVVSAIEWMQDTTQSMEADALQDSGVAACRSQLERLLMSDAEARVPTLDPGGQLGPYLEELGKAVEQGLGPQRAVRVGAQLWGVYKTHFQEALLSRLSEVLDSCCHSWGNCHVLYTWGQKTLFGQLGETLLYPPAPSQKPEARILLDPMVFVTWMSQLQKMMVGLIQEKLKESLEKVLTCDWKDLAQSPYQRFLDIFQLLEETINAVRFTGPPITSQVRTMVLETFLKFLERYQDQAASFLQKNTGARTFPHLHVLENCYILRKTWQELNQAYVVPPNLGPAVQDSIDAVEKHSQHGLLSSVRALCQSLLRGHFGRKDKDLVQALQPLWQSLEGCSYLHSSPTYESLVGSLHTVVFGEYIQALGSHLRRLAPGKWGDLQGPVHTDTWKLQDVFRKHGGPGLADLQEPIMALFQLSESRGQEAVAGWLASFSDRLPGFLRQDKPPSFDDLEVEIKVKRSCWCCC